MITVIIMFRASILCVLVIYSVYEVRSICSCLRRINRLENKINLRLGLEKAERIDAIENLREERLNVVEVFREEMREMDEKGQKKRKDGEEILMKEINEIRVDMRKTILIHQKERREAERLLQKDLETLTDKVELKMKSHEDGKGYGVANKGNRDGMLGSGVIDGAVGVRDKGRDGVLGTGVIDGAVGVRDKGRDGVLGTGVIDGAVGVRDKGRDGVLGTGVIDGAVGVRDKGRDGVLGTGVIDGAVGVRDKGRDGVLGTGVIDGAVGVRDKGSGGVLGSGVSDGAVGVRDKGRDGVLGSGVSDGAVGVRDKGSGGVLGSGVIDGTVGVRDKGSGGVLGSGVTDGAVGVRDKESGGVLGSGVIDGAVGVRDKGSGVQHVGSDVGDIGSGVQDTGSGIQSGVQDVSGGVQDTGSGARDVETSHETLSQLINNLRAGIVVEKRKSQKLEKVVNWLKKRLLNMEFLHSFEPDRTWSSVSKNMDIDKAINNITKPELGNDTQAVESVLNQTMSNSSYHEIVAPPADIANIDATDDTAVPYEFVNLRTHVHKLAMDIQHTRNRMDQYEADGRDMVQTHMRDMQHIQNQMSQYGIKIDMSREMLKRNVEHIQNDMTTHIINITKAADTMINDIDELRDHITKSDAKISGTEQTAKRNTESIEKCMTKYRSVVINTAQTITGIHNRITNCESDVSVVKNLTQDLKHIAGMKEQMTAWKPKLTNMEQILTQHIQSVQQWKTVNAAKVEQSHNSLKSLIRKNKDDSDFVAFSVGSSARLYARSWVVVPMEEDIYNPDGHFDHTTNSFTAPVSGVYSLSFGGMPRYKKEVDLYLYTKKVGSGAARGVDVARTYSFSTTGHVGVASSVIVVMEEGETATVWLAGRHDTRTALYGGRTTTFFSGKLEKRLA